MRFSTCIAASAVVLGALSLSACSGGGGGSQVFSGADLERLRSDPRIVRFGEIGDRADNQSRASRYDDYSLSAGGQTATFREVERFTCAGPRCEGDRGTFADAQEQVDIDSLLDPGAAAIYVEVRLGPRSGFDTLASTVRVEDRGFVPDVTVTDFPLGFAYGFWGRHGWAAMMIGNGSWAGTDQGVPFTGHYRWAEAYAAGDASGSNLVGTASATWTGIAEAASIDTFRRHQGTATLTIADLSAPRVNADIRIGGSFIASPGWADMPLANGRFATGTAGTDRIQGDFYGPGHSETYGTFDTDA